MLFARKKTVIALMSLGLWCGVGYMVRVSKRLRVWVGNRARVRVRLQVRVRLKVRVSGLG
jgi:hypothetical protein